MKTIEFMLTVAMSKRLIAKALMAEPAVLRAMREHRLLIVAGTTNAYVAEEALRAIGCTASFPVNTYRRGITVPHGAHVTPGQASFDLLIERGQARFDQTVFDVADDLTADDMLMKGANALHLPSGEVGVLVGHPQGGTLIPIISAAVGRRVQLIVPIGVEKRVDQPISKLTSYSNAIHSDGPRLCPLPGRAYTELNALISLTGAERADILAAGGVMGAEGCVYFMLHGDNESMERTRELIRSLKDEPPILL